MPTRLQSSPRGCQGLLRAHGHVVAPSLKGTDCVSALARWSVMMLTIAPRGVELKRASNAPSPRQMALISRFSRDANSWRADDSIRRSAAP